jgi:hypothetical protein
MRRQDAGSSKKLEARLSVSRLVTKLVCRSSKLDEISPPVIPVKAVIQRLLEAGSRKMKCKVKNAK